MQTKLVCEVFLPTTSTARVNDFILAFDRIAKEHKGRAPFVTFSGPYNDQFERNTENGRQPEAGAVSERAEAAAADFADGEPEAGTEPKPGRKPRSDAGKPRGPRGEGKAGTAAEGPERAEGGSSAEGRARGNGDGAASKGGQRGGGAREGQDGGPGGGQRRTGSPDRGNEQASPVGAADEDWDSEGTGGGDDWDTPTGEDLSDINDDMGPEWWAKTPGHDWPDTLMPEGEITRTKLSGIMSDLFRAAGGKQKGPVFDMLREVCDADQLSAVKEADFDKLARALLKETARYTHGVKKPVTTAPKA